MPKIIKLMIQFTKILGRICDVYDMFAVGSSIL